MKKDNYFRKNITPLIIGNLINRGSIHTHSYLNSASENGHKDIVQFLASNVADINHKDFYGSTALMCGIYNLDQYFQVYFILSNNSSSF